VANTAAISTAPLTLGGHPWWAFTKPWPNFWERFRRSSNTNRLTKSRNCTFLFLNLLLSWSRTGCNVFCYCNSPPYLSQLPTCYRSIVGNHQSKEKLPTLFFNSNFTISLSRLNRSCKFFKFSICYRSMSTTFYLHASFRNHNGILNFFVRHVNSFLQQAKTQFCIKRLKIHQPFETKFPSWSKLERDLDGIWTGDAPKFFLPGFRNFWQINKLGGKASNPKVQ
jgi:hypothetical protein